MNRRRFLQILAAAGAASAASALPSGAFAFDRQHRITIARLDYPGGNSDPRPGALRRLLQEVDKRTSIEVNTNIATVSGRRDEIFEYPFLFMAGDGRFEPFDDDVIRDLRTYLLAGGFLFIDSADGVREGPFLESAERELARIFPDRDLVTLPRDHTVHETFYLIDRPLGRVDVAGNLRGIAEDDRMAVLVNSNDLLGALARDTFGNWEFDVIPGGDRQREMAFRLAINVVMYALTVNYKADQVHIPFILERRRWRVD